MDVAVTPAIANTAGSAVVKVLGGLVPGVLREVRRKRAVRRSVQELSKRPATEIGLTECLEPAEVARLVAYVGLPDFEQFAIQLTGLALEGKRPDKYVADIREGMARSLQLHGVVAPGPTVEVIASSLLDELWSAVVLTIGAAGQPTQTAAMPGMAVTVSMRAAAATRNCRLLEQLRTLDDMHAFIRAVRAQISKIEGFIRPPHVESGRRVPLASLYVEPHLIKHTTEVILQPTERFVPRNILASQLRTVVLGDPGGGKSTLAAVITCQIARSTQSKRCGTVPFLVLMREYARFLEQEQMSIARYLQAMVGARYQIEPPPNCIEFLLLNGRGVVIFDGLDELINTSLRRKVVEAVEAFAYAYPTTTVLVTSRRIGYEQTSLDPTLFTTLRLAEFDDNQIETYARKWFALDPALSQGERDELTRAFIRELQYIPDLRANPLILALMCALYRGEGYIPRNRIDVYERCSALLFERWDRHRGIQVPLPFEQHVRPALWALAEWMFINGDTHPTVTERELVSTVRRFLLQKRFEDLDEADAAAAAFVDYCRGRAWVLTDLGTTSDGEPLFGFTHRTFLEFFTANQLVRTNSGARQLFDRLLPRIHNQEWDVVAQLAVLILDRYVDGGADDFLELLVRDSESRTPDERGPTLIFAARLLSHFVPTPSVRRRIFDACWNLASSADSDAPRTALDPWKQLTAAAWLLVATHENRGPIAAMIRARVSADNHPGISSLLAVTLDQLLAQSDLQMRTSEIRTIWYRESMNNLQPLRTTFIKLATKHTWAAVEAVFNGDLSITELINTHGPSAVCEAPPVWGATYRRAPIIQQEVLANHNNIDWQTPLPFATIDPRAGTWSDELATVLPSAPTPWARLSRLPWWDMDVTDPVNTTLPGTAAFETMVMCACLHWEARVLLRSKQKADLDPEPLPSWIRFPAAHPISVVVANAANARYGQDATPLDLIPDHWLSSAVRTLVERWAAREMNLVCMDTSMDDHSS